MGSLWAWIAELLLLLAKFFASSPFGGVWHVIARGI